MAPGYSGAVLKRLDGLFGAGTAVGRGEGLLLERFVGRGDGAAFEAIVARHGPMVWGVCRRMLRDPNDAEDAFQATFLILARRAGSIRQRERLGGWLHGVASKVAARARRDVARRVPREPGDLAGPPLDDEAGRLERAALLHEEIERLPGKYRDPIVLCHLEGCTHEEAAARLGWPLGTVRGRLARGRDRLRERLMRRGLTLAGCTPPALVPEIVTETTVRAAIGFAAGREVTSVISTQAASWVEGVLRTMITSKIKAVAVSIATASLMIAAGAGAMALTQAPGGGLDTTKPVEKKPSADDPSRKYGYRVSPAKVASSTWGTLEPNEAIENEIAQAEAELDVLQVRTELEKKELEQCLGALGTVKTELQGIRDIRDVDEAAKKRRVEFGVERLRTLADLSRDLESRYVQDRVALASRQRRLRALQRQAGASAGEGSIPPALEQRLSRIEASLDAIRKAVESKPRATR